MIRTDILIIGAGPAGIAAAQGASARGAKVLVLERLDFPGGRATASAVGTICGTFFRGEELRFGMNGFPRTFTEELMRANRKSPVKFSENLWFIPCHPNDFEKVALNYLSGSNLTVMYNAEVRELKLNGDLITEVLASAEDDILRIQAKEIIDCSGNGVSVALTGHRTEGSIGKQASAIVFRLDNVKFDDEFAMRHVLIKHISKGIDQEQIPASFNLLSIVPSSLENNRVLMKLGLPADSLGNEEQTRKHIHQLQRFLAASISSLEDSEIGWIAKETGRRDGLRPLGRKTLSDNDVLDCIKSDDSICNGLWPVEFWEPGNPRVKMTYFPENDHYSIPEGCLISADFSNLLFAGKLISSTDLAIASARVIGTCLGTGYAAGLIASGRVEGLDREKIIARIRREILQYN